MGASRLGVKPAECLVIEDAPAGIQAALAAGMRAIGLTSTYSAGELSKADAVISKLAQLQVQSDDGSGSRMRITVRG
jgi:sugar-phosphatase